MSYVQNPPATTGLTADNFDSSFLDTLALIDSLTPNNMPIVGADGQTLQDGPVSYSGGVVVSSVPVQAAATGSGGAAYTALNSNNQTIAKIEQNGGVGGFARLYPGDGKSESVILDGRATPSVTLYDRAAAAGATTNAHWTIYRGADGARMARFGTVTAYDFSLIAEQGRAVISGGNTAGTAEVLLKTAGTTRGTLSNSLMQFVVPGEFRAASNSAPIVAGKNAAGSSAAYLYTNSAGNGQLLLYPGGGTTSVLINGSATPGMWLYDTAAAAGGNVTADYRIYRAADNTIMSYLGIGATLDTHLIGYQGRVIIRGGNTAGTAEIQFQTGTTKRGTISNTLASFLVPVFGRALAAANTMTAGVNHNGLSVAQWYEDSGGNGRSVLYKADGNPFFDMRYDGGYLPCPASPFASGSLPNGSVSFSLDGSGNLLVTAKDAGGTVRTGTVTLSA